MTEPKAINTEFRYFYANLYTSGVNLDRDRCRNFKQEANLPILNQEETDDLQRPISLIELKEAAPKMKKGKHGGMEYPLNFICFSRRS